jgi:hypothetical protein
MRLRLAAQPEDVASAAFFKLPPFGSLAGPIDRDHKRVGVAIDFRASALHDVTGERFSAEACAFRIPSQCFTPLRPLACAPACALFGVWV